MTSSLAAEVSVGLSRTNKKQHIFTGIEDPEFAALHIASLKGHPQVPSEAKLPCGKSVVFVKPAGTVTIDSLRREIETALSHHYSEAIIKDVMDRPGSVPPSFLAKKLREGQL